MRVEKRRKRRRHSISVTVQGVWLGVMEAPTVLWLPIKQPITMYEGETLNVQVTFDDLIQHIGTATISLDDEQ